MIRPKKKSYKEFDNDKKFLRLKNSLSVDCDHVSIKIHEISANLAISR